MHETIPAISTMDDASNDKTIGRTNLSGSPVRVAQRHASSFDKNPLSSTTPASDNATLSTQVVANDKTAAVTSKPLVYTAPPAVGGAGGGSSSSFEWPTNADHYQLINRIGQGAFASVWRARIIRSRNNADDNNNENDEGDNNASAAESNKTDEIHCAIKIMDLEHVNINISGELICIRAAVVFENCPFLIHFDIFDT